MLLRRRPVMISLKSGFAIILRSAANVITKAFMIKNDLNILSELLLASGSPFRRKLLQSTGLHFRVETAQVDEDKIEAPDPAALALARAVAKAAEVALRFPGTLVIGADQVLGMDGHSYGKAADRAEARQRLREFSGRTHTLHSAFTLAVAFPGRTAAQTLRQRVVDVSMHMRPLTDAEIDAYLNTDEWRGCAGCYQAENRGVHLMLPPMGEGSAIVGLPLPELLEDLRALGVNGLLQPQGPWTLR